MELPTFILWSILIGNILQNVSFGRPFMVSIYDTLFFNTDSLSQLSNNYLSQSVHVKHSKGGGPSWGIPNVACQISEIAMSTLTIFLISMSIFKCCNVACRN